MFTIEFNVLESSDISKDLNNPTILYLTKVSTAKGRLDVAKYEIKIVMKDNKIYTVGYELNNPKLREILPCIQNPIILDKLFLASISEGMFIYHMYSLNKDTTCGVGFPFDKILESFPNTPEDYRSEYNRCIKPIKN